MSKKNRDKKFLVFNEDSEKEPFLIRKEFQKALAKEQIIEEIPLNEQIEVEETKAKKSKLKKVCIENLDYSDSKSKVIKIWRVNLEKEYYGISTIGKTTEIALLVLQYFLKGSYRLNIILIELKESLQPKETNPKTRYSTLQDIKEKIKHSMNRMYMLLTLNNHENLEKGYQNNTLYIQFKAAIFYNRNEIKNQEDANDATDLYEILNKPNINKLIGCSTILSDPDKISVEFFPKQPSDAEDNRIISLKDLL